MCNEEEMSLARQEIRDTFTLCNFCIRRIGLSFIDDKPKTFREKVGTYLNFVITLSLVFLIVVGEIAYVVGQLVKAVTIEEFVDSNVHIAGYGSMSFCKLLTIWYGRNTFRQLVGELAEVWPAAIKDRKSLDIKQNSISALKHRQLLYAFWNFLGVLFYSVTPLIIVLYYMIMGAPQGLGFVYQVAYPFDKTKPINHAIVYVFESSAGLVSVFCMLGSDLLFLTMASHISMLLRLLQQQIRTLGLSNDVHTVTRDTEFTNYYADIVAVIKVHQRLIRYINDLEDAFSVVNLINVLMSSFNICFVMFIIVLLEPWMEMSNKFFLGAVLTQMGIVCWYADDIYRASVGVSDAVYESGWYKSDPKCRRALLLVLQRSQKPLYFTAWKFSPITLATYSSILTNSYSYFTLLYTSYNRV